MLFQFGEVGWTLGVAGGAGDGGAELGVRVLGGSAGGEEEGGAGGAGVDVGGGVAVSGETGFFEALPFILGRSKPTISVGRLSNLSGAHLVAAEVFDEGVAAFEPFVLGGEGGEGD